MKFIDIKDYGNIDYISKCSMPWYKMGIKADGEIISCCAGYVIGKIEDMENATFDDFLKIWNGHKAKNLRKSLIEKKPDKFCLNCPAFKTDREQFLFQKKHNGKSIADFPIDLELHLTEKCNATCPMCVWNSIEAKKRIHVPSIPISFLKTILPKILPSCERINSSCAGELFMYPDLEEYLYLLKKFSKSYILLNTSGGISVREEVWKNILETHSIVYFSVDSFRPEVHDTIRGFSLEKVFENLDKIINLKKKYGYSTEIGFKFVIMKSTVTDLFDSVRFFYERSEKLVTSFCFSLLVEHTRFCTGDSVLNSQIWKKIYNSQIYKIKKFAEEKKIHIGSLDSFKENEEFISKNWDEIFNFTINKAEI